MTPLTPRDLSLLAKMLGRLGSDQDGEVAAAGAAVTQFLRKRGLSWDEVLIPKAAAPPAPCPPTDAFGWRQRANSCLQRSELLSVWEIEFLKSIRNRSYPPTAKQLEILNRIARSVGVAQ